MLFRRLKGRRVIVNLTSGDAVRGTVIGRGLVHVRISSVPEGEEGRSFDLIQGDGVEALAAGVARIPFWAVLFIQEL